MGPFKKYVTQKFTILTPPLVTHRNTQRLHPTALGNAEVADPPQNTHNSRKIEL